MTDTVAHQAAPISAEDWYAMQAKLAIYDEMLAALREAMRLASDENGEQFGGDLNAQESAIIRWEAVTGYVLRRADALEGGK